MTLDMVLLGGVGLFTALGAVKGASRQVAQLGGLAVGYCAARPAAKALGPSVAEATGLSLAMAAGITAVTCFGVLFLSVRFLLARAVRELLSDSEPEGRRRDRVLGGLLGGLKVAAVAYAALSVGTWIEDEVQFGGRKTELIPDGSRAAELARRYNLFRLEK
ncbi:MAG TPA: CvpA family protein [Myxococcaceae bacterium]|nr:CvpA family protein [Myxococcaceae bacterium]